MAATPAILSPINALVAAIHAVQPLVLLGGVVVKTNHPSELETVSVTFVLSPELIAAWGEECAKIGAEARL